jgi:glycosyltransferase involved in cell wall biosynthesis
MMAGQDRAVHVPGDEQHKPLVSVVMAVYNDARYVHLAVESMLAQTFSDFELVIVNDGSTDATPQILAGYRDPRLVLVENNQNLGLTRSLNRGIFASSGALIARQDSDDQSLPDRLAAQVAYLAAHPTVGLVGCGSRWIDGQDAWIRDWIPRTDPVEIQRVLLWTIPFLHGTFLLRRSCLEDVGGGYDEARLVAQDCDLVLRISERWDVSNLPEILYVHRRHEQTVTASRKGEQAVHLGLAQQAAVRRRLRYGLVRLGLSRTGLGAQGRSSLACPALRLVV